MGASCCHTPIEPAHDPRLRRALHFALWVNAGMFGVEIVGGLQAASLALWADAIDFLGDALTYAMTLAVLGAGLAARLRVARIKALMMGGLGLAVLAQALMRVGQAAVPEAPVMGAVAGLALLANLTVAWVLYRYRTGDANLQSVWLCSRNDAIGNLAVGAAALGVFGTGTAWPDLGVAALMAILGLSAAHTVWRQADREREAVPRSAHRH
ncbi:cation transporter [Inhella gelatinilytica]|uniref:Cation transporter n=1 Tax=Inhella gelatinilytica TaxID=2795030 RepID=A0A931IVR7_9BURK|nr:cation transporter [Inhella gelatinilytica]MBH9553720.1 cation transporter [Inhella gelatinilytica]